MTNMPQPQTVVQRVAPDYQSLAQIAPGITEQDYQAQHQEEVVRECMVYASQQGMWQVLALRLLETLADILSKQSRADIALTGGTDGNGMMRVLVDMLHHQRSVIEQVEWSRVHLWWGDERYVDANDPDRNALQVRQEMLDELVAVGLLPEDNIHQMPADLGNGEEGLDAQALAYEQELHAELGDKACLDLAMFGVGPDGHCASLFPNAAELRADGWVSGVRNSPKLPPLRLTLTVPFIRKSRQVWFCTSTAGKAQAVQRALSGEARADTPSSLIDGVERTLWLVDQDAASLLLA